MSEDDMVQHINDLAEILTSKEQKIASLESKIQNLRDAKDELLSISTEYLTMFQNSLLEYSTAFDLKYQDPDESDMIMRNPN